MRRENLTMLLGPSRSPRCALIRDTCNVTIVSISSISIHNQV